MFKKIKMWKINHFNGNGYFHINIKSNNVTGVINENIKLTLVQKIIILFSNGISVSFHEDF